MIFNIVVHQLSRDQTAIIAIPKFKHSTRDFSYAPVHSLIVLPRGSVRSKFDVCSYSHYRNIEKMPKFKSR